MRVPSALGVSTVISPLPNDAALVTGAAHVMLKTALVTTDGETNAGVAPVDTPALPVVPDALLAGLPDAVEDVPEAVLELFPLAAAAAPPPLATSPGPPPPPHAANASRTEYIEKLSNAFVFIFDDRPVVAIKQVQTQRCPRRL
ncbi:hypothetical protein [Caballeronia sp. dw_276]|jgi:hypothetical protein|uniref:hypothetical protein n=1 Tax=Caballeronia sp. dw_276 TaxID=2719795 RepID=UPI002102DF8D|nr:hypothetical protein [Caballeronia sp. dw_276]